MDEVLPTEAKTKKVWLAIADPKTEQEHHMEWEGHPTKESAEKEFVTIKNAIRCDKAKYPNTYIYEAEEPLYGYPIEKFDLSYLEETLDFVYGGVKQKQEQSNMTEEEKELAEIVELAQRSRK